MFNQCNVTGLAFYNVYSTAEIDEINKPLAIHKNRQHQTGFVWSVVQWSIYKTNSNMCVLIYVFECKTTCSVLHESMTAFTLKWQHRLQSVLLNCDMTRIVMKRKSNGGCCTSTDYTHQYQQHSQTHKHKHRINWNWTIMNGTWLLDIVYTTGKLPNNQRQGTYTNEP